MAFIYSDTMSIQCSNYLYFSVIQKLASVIKIHKIMEFIGEYKIIAKGENHYESGNVHTCNFVLGVLTGNVRSSMKNKLNSVEIRIKNYSVEYAKCSCAIGQTKCSHMIALLLHANKHISVTDSECSWRKKRCIDDDMVKSIDDLYPDNFSVVKSTNCDLKKLCFEKLKISNHVVGYSWLLKPEPVYESSTDDVNLPQLESILFSREFQNAMNKKEFIFNLFKLDQNEIEKIAADTTGQSENIKWSLYRRYRLTASNFHKILKCINQNKFPPSLFQTILGNYNLHSVRAIQWGNNHEQVALDEFKNKFKIDVLSTGIWLHETGILGASPDGLATINNKQYCVEIKCPFKYRNQDLKHCLSVNTDYIIKFDTDINNYILNTSHEYFTQIQGQICLTKSEGCILIIWTTKSIVAVEIEKNCNWDTNIDRLIDFYFTVYIQWVLNNNTNIN